MTLAVPASFEWLPRRGPRSPPLRSVAGSAALPLGSRPSVRGEGSPLPPGARLLPRTWGGLGADVVLRQLMCKLLPFVSLPLLLPPFLPSLPPPRTPPQKNHLSPISQELSSSSDSLDRSFCSVSGSCFASLLAPPPAMAGPACSPLPLVILLIPPPPAAFPLCHPQPRHLVTQQRGKAGPAGTLPPLTATRFAPLRSTLSHAAPLPGGRNSKRQDLERSEPGAFSATGSRECMAGFRGGGGAAGLLTALREDRRMVPNMCGKPQIVLLATRLPSTQRPSLPGSITAGDCPPPRSPLLGLLGKRERETCRVAVFVLSSEGGNAVCPLPEFEIGPSCAQQGLFRCSPRLPPPIKAVEIRWFFLCRDLCSPVLLLCKYLLYLLS